MTKRLAIALVVLAFCAHPAPAMVLEGSVEHFEEVKDEVVKVVKKKSFFARLFGSCAEGRIGVRVDHTFGGIDYVHPNSPAEKSGLLAGDVVILVDGMKDRIGQISGDPGTTVHLDLKRDGNDFAVDVERIDYHDIQK